MRRRGDCGRPAAGRPATMLSAGGLPPQTQLRTVSALFGLPGDPALAPTVPLLTIAMQACWVPSLGWGFDFQVGGSVAELRCVHTCCQARERDRRSGKCFRPAGLDVNTFTPLAYFRTILCRRQRTSICRISETQWTVSLQASAVSLWLSKGRRGRSPLRKSN